MKEEALKKKRAKKLRKGDHAKTDTAAGGKKKSGCCK